MNFLKCRILIGVVMPWSSNGLQAPHKLTEGSVSNTPKVTVYRFNDPKISIAHAQFGKAGQMLHLDGGREQCFLEKRVQRTKNQPVFKQGTLVAGGIGASSIASSIVGGAVCGFFSPFMFNVLFCLGIFLLAAAALYHFCKMEEGEQSKERKRVITAIENRVGVECLLFYVALLVLGLAGLAYNFTNWRPSLIVAICLLIIMSVVLCLWRRQTDIESNEQQALIESPAVQPEHETRGDSLIERMRAVPQGDEKGLKPLIDELVQVQEIEQNSGLKDSIKEWLKGEWVGGLTENLDTRTLQVARDVPWVMKDAELALFFGEMCKVSGSYDDAKAKSMVREMLNTEGFLQKLLSIPELNSEDFAITLCKNGIIDTENCSCFSARFREKVEVACYRTVDVDKILKDDDMLKRVCHNLDSIHEELGGNEELALKLIRIGDVSVTDVGTHFDGSVVSGLKADFGLAEYLLTNNKISFEDFKIFFGDRFKDSEDLATTLCRNGIIGKEEISWFSVGVQESEKVEVACYRAADVETILGDDDMLNRVLDNLESIPEELRGKLDLASKLIKSTTSLTEHNKIIDMFAQQLQSNLKVHSQLKLANPEYECDVDAGGRGLADDAAAKRRSFWGWLKFWG